MKTCIKCGEDKPDSSEFFPSRSNGRLRNECKRCKSDYLKTYRERNRSLLATKKKAYTEKNRDRIKAYREQNRERINQKQKQRYLKNKEKMNAQSRAYGLANRSYFTEKMRGYRESDPERFRRLSRESYYRNKANRVKNAIDYERKRMSEDPAFLLVKRLRCRIWYALCGAKRQHSTVELLGCTPEHARGHLESQFKPGMSWENYGDWHIDHIRPCSSFDLTDPEQQKQCFHYSNLQPLWAQENLSKGAKMVL